MFDVSFELFFSIFLNLRTESNLDFICIDYLYVQKSQSLGVNRRLERASLRAIAKKIYQRRQGASPSDSSVSREGSSGEESLSVLTKLLDLISMQNASVESITATVRNCSESFLCVLLRKLLNFSAFVSSSHASI